MPPKSKKEAQQQALRQQQQRKRREQEAARLQAQRKKYRPQTLPTGLILIVSAQLINDFYNKPELFVTEKLKDGLKDAYPGIMGISKLEFILKQLHYYIKDSLILFGQATAGQTLHKHRIFIGIMMNLLNNALNEEKQNNINRAQDQKLAKQLVTTHCNKCQGYTPLLKQEGLVILKYLKQKFFSRYLLMKVYDKFPKRQTQQSFPLYIQTPSIYYTNDQTIWTDLSKPLSQQKIS